MGLIADFKKGRDAAYKKRGFVPGQKDEPADDSADEKVAGEAAHAADVDIAELAETRRKLLEELSAEIENLRKRVGELETERDEAKKLLADVVAEAEGHKESLAAVEAERNEAKKLLAEVTASVETRIAEVESERDLLADVLQATGVRKVLQKVLHPDTHPKADEDQRRGFTKATSKLNAAYDLIDRRAKKKTP